MPKPIPASISGSTAATILGLNHYETPFERWQLLQEQLKPGFNSLHGYVMPEQFDGNASTRFGSAFESACIALTEEKIGQSITERESIFTSAIAATPDETGFSDIEKACRLSCHVDGLVHRSNKTISIINGNNYSVIPIGSTILYEGKTTTMNAFRYSWDVENNIIPRNYMIQIHHNMYLSGASEAIVSCLVFPETPEKWEEMGWEVDMPDFADELDEYFLLKSDEYDRPVVPLDWARTLSDMGFHHIFRIPRNDELINTMLEKYSQWWEKYIIGELPPDPVNIDDIKRLCPEVSGTIVIEDDSLIDAISEYSEIGKEIGSGGNLSKRCDQLKTMFLDGARKLHSEIDDESTNKWVFRDSRGHKLGSWGKNKNGTWTFRA